MLKKIEKKNHFKNCNRGFVILISVVVSVLLLSIGLFISEVAYKELLLSTSVQSSQKAFYIADSVVECALRHDIRGLGFKTNGNNGGTMECNNNVFQADSFSYFSREKKAISVFFISFANPNSNSNELDENNIPINEGKNKPYAKLVVTKTDIGGINDKTVIQVYGNNIYSGPVVTERGLKVEY